MGENKEQEEQETREPPRHLIEREIELLSTPLLLPDFTSHNQLQTK